MPFNFIISVFLCSKFLSNIAKSVNLFFDNFCTLGLPEVISKLRVIKISYIIFNALSFLCLTPFGIPFEIFQVFIF